VSFVKPFTKRAHDPCDFRGCQLLAAIAETAVRIAKAIHDASVKSIQIR
jgi:hypothetical protein